MHGQVALILTHPVFCLVPNRVVAASASTIAVLWRPLIDVFVRSSSNRKKNVLEMFHCQDDDELVEMQPSILNVTASIGLDALAADYIEYMTHVRSHVPIGSLLEVSCSCSSLHLFVLAHGSPMPSLGKQGGPVLPGATALRFQDLLCNSIFSNAHRCALGTRTLLRPLRASCQILLPASNPTSTRQRGATPRIGGTRIWPKDSATSKE